MGSPNHAFCQWTDWVSDSVSYADAQASQEPALGSHGRNWRPLMLMELVELGLRLGLMTARACVRARARVCVI